MGDHGRFGGSLWSFIFLGPFFSRLARQIVPFALAIRRSLEDPTGYLMLGRGNLLKGDNLLLTCELQPSFFDDERKKKKSVRKHGQTWLSSFRHVAPVHSKQSTPKSKFYRDFGGGCLPPGDSTSCLSDLHLPFPRPKKLS